MSDIDEAVRLARDIVAAANGDAWDSIVRATYDQMRLGQWSLKLARAVLALHERCEKMTAVYEAALAWGRAGGDPCGEPDCCCTECRLWAAVDAARENR